MRDNQVTEHLTELPKKSVIAVGRIYPSNGGARIMVTLTGDYVDADDEFIPMVMTSKRTFWDHLGMNEGDFDPGGSI